MARHAEGEHYMNESTIKTEIRFTGLPISGGISLARVCLFNERRHSNLPSYRVVGEGAELEKGRVQQAIKAAGVRLDTLIQKVMDQVGPAEYVPSLPQAPRLCGYHVMVQA